MAKEKTRYYRLARPYWDGKRTQPRGAIVALVEGTQPSTASLMTDAEMADLNAADKAAAAVAVQLPENFYEEVVVEVTAKVLEALEKKAEETPDEGMEPLVAAVLEALDARVVSSAPEVPKQTTSSAEGGSTPADPKAKK